MFPVIFGDPQPLQPHVRVWDSVSLSTLQIIGLGTFERGVGSLAFSKAVSLTLNVSFFCLTTPSTIPSILVYQRLQLIQNCQRPEGRIHYVQAVNYGGVWWGLTPLKKPWSPEGHQNKKVIWRFTLNYKDTFLALTDLKWSFWSPLRWIIPLIIPKQLN